ncbi:MULTISPECIES: porin [unclassified Thioalkalivibrio]|uniref:porin n=1 Tax=unclassified Thioalkalivibrio TaxID=2621013 RepID=UPI000375D6CC|nr:MULTISPECIES: porin [unclassified Thioalkalivibrio]
MNRKTLVAAMASVFAFPAMAAADSSVTLFGQLQPQIVYQSASGDDSFDSGFRQYDGGGARQAANGSNPGRLGVLVRHDLGNGLTALAKMEQDANTVSGFGSGPREIYVGLSGDFGRVIVGRLTSPYSTAGKDPLNATFMQQRVLGGRLSPGGYGWGGFVNGSYLDRGIRYTNDFGPVYFDIATFLDNEDDSNSAFAARLAFDLGATEIYGAYQRGDENNQTEGLSILDGFNDAFADNLRVAKLGADWRQGPWRLNFEAEDAVLDDADGVEVFDGNTYFAAGTYRMGETDFTLSLGHTRNTVPDDTEKTDSAAIAVTHHLSNRVRIFGGVAYTKEKDNVNDPSYTAVGGGMRVAF